VVLAVGLMMHVHHQPLPIIKKMSLSELFVWAKLAAQIIKVEFD